MSAQTGDGRSCVSCGAGGAAVKLHRAAPGIAICRSCVGDGFAQEGVFRSLIYTIRWQVRHSVEALEQKTIRNQNCVGWNHFLDVKRVAGVSSTAYAVGLLNQLDPSLPELPAAVDRVRSAYIDDVEGKRSGGWPMASIPGVILTEPTCYCAGQLIRAGFLSGEDREVVGAVNWLLGKQHYDGGWSPQAGHAVGCYTTALVVASLGRWRNGLSTSFAEPVGKAIERGIAWLVNAVNDDGGWGRKCRAQSDPWHTAHSLRAIFAVGGEENYDHGRRAIEYLLKRREDWRNVVVITYDVNTNDRSERAHYVCHPMPIVVQTLLSAGVSPHHPDIVTAILDMTEGQDPTTGTWHYPDGRGTIFELCHNAECLGEFIDRANWAGPLLDLQRQMGKLAKKVEETEKAVKEMAGMPVVKRQWETGVVGSAVAGLLVYTGADWILPEISDGARLLPAATVTVVVWALHRCRISRNRLERIGYAILAATAFVVYGFVEPLPNTIQAASLAILVALLVKLLLRPRR